MKSFKNKFIVLLSLLLVFSCDNGIDPITAVDPGPDAGAPVINIVKPTEGFEIQVPEPVTSVNIQFKVEDDIEVSLITVQLDGVEIATYNDFLDYRIVNREMTYDNVTTGDHVLIVEATDIAGNVTTKVSNFTKTPPYTPLFDGEMFYMAFDGSYTDLVSNVEATEVGNPGFAGQSKVGTNAYAGATGSYLTYPTNGLLGNEFSASFWYKVNGTPDRAGILVIGPPDDANPDAPNNRNNGFRFFREGGATNQTFKLNVGNGTADSWFDGGAAATIDPTVSTDWIHLAFTISDTEAVVYMNGEVVSQGPFPGVDWTGGDMLSIMSGAPRFTGWGHLSDLSYMDELRLFNVALSQSEIVNLIAQSSKIFNMPFEGGFTESISKTGATEVGNPGFAGESKVGTNAYAGATDSYLTYPTDGLLGNEFSATFWYKVNGTPDRAGILVIGPPDDANPDAPNNRNNGFRFFREGGATNQTFKLNVGNGTADSWFDGGAAATIDPTVSTDWIHLAFTISDTEAVVYMNGEVVSQGPFPGVDWTGGDILSIMSGAPRFTGWGHLSDLSYMDALALYNKALSQAEIQAIMNN